MRAINLLRYSHYYNEVKKINPFSVILLGEMTNYIKTIKKLFKKE
jgi:hypothetical protein